MKNQNSGDHKKQIEIRKLFHALTFSFTALIFSTNGIAQGLINNGARIIINGATANVIVDGGSGLGNFTNKDTLASTGIVENTGVFLVSGNWTNNSAQYVFAANAGTVNLYGTTQTIGGSTTTYFNNLSLTGASTALKTLGIDELVGGGFASPGGMLSLGVGQITLNSHKLTVSNPATAAVTRTSGYIISETNAAFNPSIIQWNCGTTTGGYIFPFGSSHGYTPITVTKNSATSSNLIVSTRATAAADNLIWGSGVAHMNSPTIGGSGAIPVVIDRWYYVSASATINVNLAFTYAGIENTTTYSPTGTFGAQNWTGVWSAPMGSGSGVTTGTAVVTATSQNIGPTNNNWVLANTLAPLPIHLLSFHANCEGKNAVHIQWQTETEVNVSDYIIERSSDGVHFQSIASVPVQSTASSVNNYEWTDDNLQHSTAYYRLKENDVNGQQTIFNMVSVKSCIGEESTPIEIYSSASSIHFNINDAEFNDCLIQVFDAAGKLVMKKVHPLLDGNNTFQVATELAPGIYFAQCQVGNVVTTKKVAISK